MGCGNEISDWDDKAVKDSLAGKNTGPDPKILEEIIKEIRPELDARLAYARELYPKVSGFEKSGVVQDRDIVHAISHVPLARQIYEELNIKHGVVKIAFEKDLKGPDGQSRRGEAKLDLLQGTITIKIGSAQNATKADYQRTVLHELGECYFRDILSLEEQEKWIEMRREARMLSDIQKDEGEKRDVDDKQKGQHHFAERFAEYCVAQLESDPKIREEEIQNFKNTYPKEAEEFDRLIAK